MTSRALAAAVALALGSSGCSLLVELVEADERAEPSVDAGSDVDAACVPWPQSPPSVDVCELQPAGPALVLGPGAWTFDTNSGALTDPAQNATFPTSELVTPAEGPELRVLSTARFEVEAGGSLRVVGRRPLLVVATTEIVVAGIIDLTSRADAAAAGSDPDACGAIAASPGVADAEGGSGGGGGGFGEIGALGGGGDDGLTLPGPASGAETPPFALRGGCPGGDGGNLLGGGGGAGGGAIHLAAHDLVEITGVITAGGAGGGAAQGGRSGGGGGGSGGFIGVTAPSVILGDGAVLAANGGGGGGGCDGSPALPGGDGQASATPAAPGGGQGMGAAGGAGGALDAPPDPGLTARRGGGGGGGGVGAIVMDAASLDVAATAVVSPAATP